MRLNLANIVKRYLVADTPALHVKERVKSALGSALGVGLVFSAIEAHDSQLAARVSREHVDGIKEMFMEIEQDEQRLIRSQMRLAAES